MSADLSIGYTAPIRFGTFASEFRHALSRLLDVTEVPELIEFSAPTCPSTGPRTEYLGPEGNWLLLGFKAFGGLVELGVCPGPPRPEFCVATNGGPLSSAVVIA